MKIILSIFEGSDENYRVIDNDDQAKLRKTFTIKEGVISLPHLKF